MLMFSQVIIACDKAKNTIAGWVFMVRIYLLCLDSSPLQYCLLNTLC